MAFDFNELEPEIQGAAYELFLAAADAGLLPQMTSGRRTTGQQLRLWKNYLKGASRFPALPPGLSAHEYGVAFDMLVRPEDYLADVGYTWETWGGVWGGQGDPVHFEIPSSRSYVLRHLSLNALTSAIDFALMFVPGKVGAVGTGAGILQLFPAWSHSAVLSAISSPATTIRESIEAYLNRP